MESKWRIILFQFLKQTYEEKLELINSYRDNFIKIENYDNIDGLLQVDYFLHDYCFCKCLWKSKNSIFISTCSISPSSISSSSISSSKISCLVISAILEELSDYDVVYFLKDKSTSIKFLNKYCSSNSIIIELDKVLKINVVGIRGNLEANDSFKFPLVYFN